MVKSCKNLSECMWSLVLNFKRQFYLRLSAMDVSDLVTMKNAASCEMQCDMRTSVNH